MELSQLGNIPDRYRRTLSDDNFFLVGTFDDEEHEAGKRVIVFAT